MKNKILAYLKETWVEMKKVVWPDRHYVSVATAIVLGLVVLTAGALMFLDHILAIVFKALLR